MRYYVIKKQAGGWFKRFEVFKVFGEALGVCHAGQLPWVILDDNNDVIRQSENLTEEDIKEAVKVGGL